MIGITNHNNNENESSEEGKFGITGTVRCYCGKKMKIIYNEVNGLKDTYCKDCGYNHIDIIYELKKHVLEYASKENNNINKKKKWWQSFY